MSVALDACCRVLTLLPALPWVMAAVACEQARYSLPSAGFRADQEARMSEPWAPVPAGDREASNAA
ncbi:hypothetical protein ABZ092_23730 [Streptomyces bobili]|uniref:hypothetical protein n=1 Tax=Streptomyces bobili TaxID=67280 RepID=UPI0033A80F80